MLTCISFFQCIPERVAGGAGAGNPPLGEVTLALKAKSSGPRILPKSTASGLIALDSGFVIRDSAGAVLSLDSIVSRVEGIDFALPDSLDCPIFSGLPCKDGETTLEGPFDLDLLRGISHPALNVFKIPAGLYRKIGFKLIANKQDSLTDWDSTSQNIVLWGRMGALGSAGQRFVIRINLTEGLDFGDPVGVRIKSDTLNNILLGLNVDDWFQGTDMQACMAASPAGSDSAGIVRLQGDGFCSGTGIRVRRNIEASGGINYEDQVEQP